MYRIDFTLSALKDLKKIDPLWQRKILDRIKLLASGFQNDHQIKKIKGGPRNRFRVRVGDYRIVFDQEEGIKILLILRIGHRKEIYRSLS